VPTLVGSALVSFLCICFVLAYIAQFATKTDTYEEGYKAGVAYAEVNHKQFVIMMNKDWPCAYSKLVCKTEKSNGPKGKED
jgi:hypothetical protein